MEVRFTTLPACDRVMEAHRVRKVESISPSSSDFGRMLSEARDNDKRTNRSPSGRRKDGDNSEERK